jgi:hypothetical protein
VNLPDVLGRLEVEPDPEPRLPSAVARQQREELEKSDPRVADRARVKRKATLAGIAAWEKELAKERGTGRGRPDLLPPPVPVED